MMQSLAKIKNKKKGFTLVELIVVIAIIAILAAVLLPKYFGFTDNARQSNALSEAKSIRGIYETLYANSGNGVWPVIPTSAISTAPKSFIINDGVNDNTFPGAITPTTDATTKVADGGFTFDENNGWSVECNAAGHLIAYKTGTAAPANP
ncbi:MAG: prepilin-type N-terminal cleavage/methylation domain-containing protein [Desulfosporosinus sp.]|nr:prepilin-type N-terminal cleavage/methylation domain-containing protein [Desulfosporosinus sp.]